jgi:acylphosphatase
VRNLPDRSVEVVAEGDADAMERFERSVRIGPPGARVDRIDVDNTYPVAGETEFSIK